jgi:hypothetical protein
MGRACSTHWEKEESIEDFGGKARKKEPLGRPRRRWEDNNKMDFRDGVIWIGLIWFWTGTSGGFCEHGNEPSGSRTSSEIIE